MTDPSFKSLADGLREEQVFTKRQERVLCDSCAEAHATKKHQYVHAETYNRRGQFSSDFYLHQCDNCDSRDDEDLVPINYKWNGTYSFGSKFDHLFFHWVEKPCADALIAALERAKALEAENERFQTALDAVRKDCQSGHYVSAETLYAVQSVTKAFGQDFSGHTDPIDLAKEIYQAGHDDDQIAPDRYPLWEELSDVNRNALIGAARQALKDKEPSDDQ